MEIDKLVEGAYIVRYIKARRIKWLGHIQRMDGTRPARKILNWKPMGIRPVGRPRQRWQEYFMEDPKKKVKVKNWKGITKDRRTWRDLSEKAKTQKGLMCQMMSVIMQDDPFIVILDSHYQTRV